MFEGLLTIFGGSWITLIGALAMVTSIITQFLKNLLPKNFPTKLLVMIVSLIITILSTIIFCGVSIQLLFFSIIGSFIVGFISLYGFDTFKEIMDRYKVGLIKEDSGAATSDSDDE